MLCLSHKCRNFSGGLTNELLFFLPLSGDLIHSFNYHLGVKDSELVSVSPTTSFTYRPEFPTTFPAGCPMGISNSVYQKQTLLCLLLSHVLLLLDSLSLWMALSSIQAAEPAMPPPLHTSSLGVCQLFPEHIMSTSSHAPLLGCSLSLEYFPFSFLKIQISCLLICEAYLRLPLPINYFSLRAPACLLFCHNTYFTLGHFINSIAFINAEYNIRHCHILEGRKRNDFGQDRLLYFPALCWKRWAFYSL